MKLDDNPATKPKSRRPRAEEKVKSILDNQIDIVHQIMVAALVLRLSPVLVPVLLRFVLDPLLAHRSIDLLGITLSPERLLLIVTFAGLMVAVIRTMANYRFMSLAGKCGHSLVADLRQAMFEHILRLPVSYVDRRGTGRILLRFIGDSDALRNWASKTSPNFSADRILVLILIGIMFSLDWKLALIVLAPLPMLFLIIRKWSLKLREMTKEARGLQAKLTGFVESRFSNIRETKWLDSTKQNRHAGRTVMREIADRNTARDQFAAKLDSIGQFIAFLAIPLVLVSGTWMVWSNEVTIGEYIAFFWLAAHLSISLNRMVSAVVIREKANVSIERILRLLERSSEAGRSENASKVPKNQRAFKLQQLVFSETGSGSPDMPLDLTCDQPGVYVLDEHIECRTLYEAILGFVKPTSGKIILNDESKETLDIVDIRKATAWITERPVLFEGTIEENITLPLSREKRNNIIPLLSLFEILPKNPEDWLNSSVRADGHNLSLEEKHLICLIRVMLLKPMFVLIEDIPYSSKVAAYLVYVIEYLSDHSIILVSSRTAEWVKSVTDSTILPTKKALGTKCTGIL